MLKIPAKYSNLLISWSVLILVLTLVPIDSMHMKPDINMPFFDKMVHFCLFSVHGYLVTGYLKDRDTNNTGNFRLLVSAVISSFLFGLSIEIIQHFVPERSFEILDLIADFFGIMAGTLIFYIKFNFFTN